DGPGFAAVSPHSQRAHEICVTIFRAQFLFCIGPFSCDASAAYDAARFDLEDIGKVGAHGDLKLEAHRLYAVVGDVDVLVHAVRNGPAHDEAESARRDRAILCQEGAVRQIDGRGVVGRGAAVQEIPGLAISINRPAAQYTGVEKVKAALTGPVDLGIGFGDEHRLSV